MTRQTRATPTLLEKEITDLTISRSNMYLKEKTKPRPNLLKKCMTKSNKLKPN